MIITSTSEVPGKKIKEILGIAKGSTVRSKHLGRDIAAGFKSMVGGELKGYTEMLSESREESYNRMVNNAMDLGGRCCSKYKICNIFSITSGGRTFGIWDCC